MADQSRKPLTEEQEARLDALVTKIDEVAQWSYEYNTENSDSVCADYCAWAWKEGDRDEPARRLLDDDWAPESVALCGLARKTLSLEQLTELLVEVAGEPTYSAGYGRNAGEIFSVAIGEIEEQCCKGDHDWVEEFLALPTDEREYVERSVRQCTIRCGAGDWCVYLYTSDDGRWCLIIDEEALATALLEKGAVTQAQVDEIFGNETEAK